LILPIGKWVLCEASRQMQKWNKQFPSTPIFTVAVNISAKQFDQPDIVNEIQTILCESDLTPSSLKLELTESVTMRDESRTTRILRELKTLGVRLCIDDFGTGYSSLSYLRRFSLDVLKIDRSFVSEMLKSGGSCEIVKTLLNLGNNLGMEVIAEGVETPEQVSLLKSLACEYAQGNFFSRPLDQQEVSRTLLTLGTKNHAILPRTPESPINSGNPNAGVQRVSIAQEKRNLVRRLARRSRETPPQGL
jgi:EAL domain-containing protein (putative c-di-GMP-specific phosphodiesterase class I)